jgi:hypothetical protein
MEAGFLFLDLNIPGEDFSRAIKKLADVSVLETAAFCS